MTWFLAIEKIPGFGIQHGFPFPHYFCSHPADKFGEVRQGLFLAGQFDTKDLL